MPAFGAHALPYGDLVNAIAPAERASSNAISAVNFDIRGFDTLGEEFMLLCAVTGVGRAAARQAVASAGGRPLRALSAPGRCDSAPQRGGGAERAGSRGPAITVLFGAYVALHAMTTPGGGFQGGVIVASGALLLFLGEGYRGWRRRDPQPRLLDASARVFGAALYALCGFASMSMGLPFLQNFLPFGAFRDVFSGGLMLVENAGVACAVTGGFVLLFIEFLEETRASTVRATARERRRGNSALGGRGLAVRHRAVRRRHQPALCPHRSAASRWCSRRPTCCCSPPASAGNAIAPIFYTHPPGTPAVDPVLQALVLTDVVIGATVTALLLALALQLHKKRATLNPDALRPLRQ